MQTFDDHGAPFAICGHVNSQLNVLRLAPRLADRSGPRRASQSCAGSPIGAPGGASGAGSGIGRCEIERPLEEALDVGRDQRAAARCPAPSC